MKNRLPRKQKKRLKKAITVISNNFNDVFRQAFLDEFLWGVSAIHVNKETGEIKNVPIDEALNLRHNAKI